MQDAITNTDLDEIVINTIKNHGLYPHIVESFNTFCTSGINEILTNIFRIEKIVPMLRTETESDREIDFVKFEVKFLKVNLSKPMEDDKTPLFPAIARRKDKSYMGSLKADILTRATAYLHSKETVVKEAMISNYEIAEIPIMVGSILCNTYGMTREALERIGENPSDPHGLFIINGSEWTINNLNDRKYNSWHVRHNEHDREHARAEFISRPGDSYENSSEIIIRYLMTGEITIQLTSDKYFKTVELPFYVVLRLFGLPMEEIIVDNICKQDQPGPMTGSSERTQEDLIVKMRRIIINACTIPYTKFKTNFRQLTSSSEIMEALIEEIAVKYVDTKGIVSLDDRQSHIINEKKILREVIMSNFDNNVLPHHGRTAQSRFVKALYICIGARKLLDCYFDLIPSTNLDSVDMKRNILQGDTLSRVVKREFNREIVGKFKMNFDSLVLNNNFYAYDLDSAVKSCIKSAVLVKQIISNLNQGMSEKTVNGEVHMNRTPSENPKRKNNLNLINSGTIIRSTHSSQAKYNDRAIEIRAVQADFAHNRCMIQSAEGVNAGMIQNTTMGVTVSISTSTEIMINVLLEMKEIIPYDHIMGIDNVLTKVYVNGKWIGYTKNPAHLYKYFRERRRGWDMNTGQRIENEIMDRRMTMCWNNNQKEIDFRTDRGRSMSPFVVVYNNTTKHGQHVLAHRLGIKTKGDPWTGEGFEQHILLTMDHIRKLHRNELTTKDLFHEGIIDYIAPEELKQIVCAETIETIRAHQKNFYQLYTHLCIPSTLLSITSALTPYGHNCPPTRIILAGNHIRQACDNSYRYDNRFDKQNYYMPDTEAPLVYTNTNLFVMPFALNSQIAVAAYDGGNIEDSLIQNKAFAEANAYFTIKFTYFAHTLDSMESFGKPDAVNTEGINKDVNYGKLNREGYVPRGTRVVAGDAIIGCMFKYQEIKVGGFNYRDISEVYDLNEPGYVVGVETGRNGACDQFIKIRVEILRPMGTGEKMASRSGQKGMTAMTLPQSDLPFTASGIIPAYILNPHAFPSRQTGNQKTECVVGKLAQKLMTTMNGSFMVSVDNRELGDALMREGMAPNGTEVMYNGRTGVAYNMNIFIGPVYQCRLQKFSAEGAYAVGNNGPRSYTTRQPVNGRARDGGIKLGEMEKDCFAAQSAIRFFMDKKFHDCDGIRIYLCRTCGYEAIGNRDRQFYQCKICGPLGQVIEYPTNFGSHLIKLLFTALGAKLQYIMRPFGLISN